MKYCGKILRVKLLAYAFALRRIDARERSDNMIDQTLHHHLHGPIDTPLETKVDAADEGVRHFAVGKNADFGADFAVDRIDTCFDTLDDAAHDRRQEAGDHDRIAFFRAKPGKHQASDVFQKQVFNDAEHADLTEPLHAPTYSIRRRKIRR